jgi:hypothetical protein
LVPELLAMGTPSTFISNLIRLAGMRSTCIL